MDWPKIRSVVPDPVNPNGRRLVLLRVAERGTNRCDLNDKISKLE